MMFAVLFLAAVTLCTCEKRIIRPETVNAGSKDAHRNYGKSIDQSSGVGEHFPKIRASPNLAFGMKASSITTLPLEFSQKHNYRQAAQESPRPSDSIFDLLYGCKRTKEHKVCGIVSTDGSLGSVGTESIHFYNICRRICRKIAKEGCRTRRRRTRTARKCVNGDFLGHTSVATCCFLLHCYRTIGPRRLRARRWGAWAGRLQRATGCGNYWPR